MKQHKQINTLVALGALLVLAGAGCFGVNSGEEVNQYPYGSEERDEYGQTPVNQTPAKTPNAVNTNTNTTMTYSAPTVLPKDQIEGKYAHIETSKGKIVIALYGDTAPLTVSNFVNLTSGGYYDGLTFHRREEGFVIQGGDPNGNGTGGPGYRFADELNDGRKYTRGTVAMANAGPNTNGSQFFVMLDDVPLPKLYSIFGEVVSGMDVVDQIKIGDVMTKVTIEDQK